MRTPKWSKRDLENPDYDLYKRVGGIEFDVIGNVNGTWSVLIALKRVATGLESRQAAMDFIESLSGKTVSDIIGGLE